MPITTLLSCVIFQRKQRIPDSCLRLPQHKRLYGNSSSILQLILYVRRKCNKRENLRTKGIIGRMQKRTGHQARSLRRRCNPTQASNVCKAAPRPLFVALNGLNELPEESFEFPFSLICQLNIFNGPIMARNQILAGTRLGAQLRTDLQRNSLYCAARIANFEGILGFSVPSIF